MIAMNLNDAHQLADIIGPKIREAIREDIKEAVQESCEPLAKTIKDHGDRITNLESLKWKAMAGWGAFLTVIVIIFELAKSKIEAWWRGH